VAVGGLECDRERVIADEVLQIFEALVRPLSHIES
jgi:hypothetical protein